MILHGRIRNYSRMLFIYVFVDGFWTLLCKEHKIKSRGSGELLHKEVEWGYIKFRLLLEFFSVVLGCSQVFLCTTWVLFVLNMF